MISKKKKDRIYAYICVHINKFERKKDIHNFGENYKEKKWVFVFCSYHLAF
jgi:hypothetical protein